MITVDQERMKEFISMGFDKEEAFRMCKDEADALNKEEAKAAKAAAKEPEPTLSENNDINDSSTEFIKKDEVNSIVKDTIKGLKDDEEFKNFLTGGDGTKEEPRTMDSVINRAVEKMRTGK